MSRLLETCWKGKLEHAQLEVFKMNDLDDILLEFNCACSHGQIEIAKWFISICPTIEISFGNECAFRTACENGHLKVAQWLLSIKPDINVSALNEYAFRIACEQGNLNVAQWLLSINPSIDVSVRNEESFRSACLNGHLNVRSGYCPSNQPLMYPFAMNMHFVGHVEGDI